MFYADTSVVLPFYRTEGNSAAVEAIFMGHPGQIGLSPLVRVEAASAIARWHRTGEITASQARQIESAMEADIAADRFQHVPLPGEVFEQALHWLSLRETSLRALDALHLAAAAQQKACLLTADQKLAEAAYALDVAYMALESMANAR
ncbi:type II toxin-antitoxin system VapC family toxin [Spiribacter sp. 218]|uniref:type II toxin-antitoxin system VapC family toxin n=1 Tax=Spiribacter pallidus TaxID=1987936 RepID=UPI00349FADE2